MIKYICDRCGKEVKISPIMPYNRVVLITDGLITKKYSLCIDCLRAVQEYAGKWAEQEGERCVTL